MEQNDDIVQQLQNMPDVPVSHSLIPTVLAHLGLENEGASSHTSIEALALLLRHDAWEERLSAVRKLRLLAEPKADELLRAASEDENEFVRIVAIQALETRSSNKALSQSSPERGKALSASANQKSEMGNRHLAPRASSVKIFCSHTAEDRALSKQLEMYLPSLLQEEVITIWHDHQIEAGSDWTSEIEEHLSVAQIILLLVSQDLLASDYCYSPQMQRAIARHKRGKTHIIPIIMRPCEWQKTPFAYLQVLPHNGMPVTVWENQDAAWQAIIQEIGQAVAQLSSPKRLLPHPPSQELTLQVLPEETEHLGFLHHTVEEYMTFSLPKTILLPYHAVNTSGKAKQRWYSWQELRREMVEIPGEDFQIPRGLECYTSPEENVATLLQRREAPDLFIVHFSGHGYSFQEERDLMLSTQYSEERGQRERTEHLLDIAQQVLSENTIILQSCRVQDSQNTLHIACSTPLSETTRLYAQRQFQLRTGWTLGIASRSSHREAQAQPVEQRATFLQQEHLLRAARNVLPSGAMLQRSTFQYSQQTLHVACTMRISRDALHQIKKSFHMATGWTLGVQYSPLNSRPGADQEMLLSPRQALRFANAHLATLPGFIRVAFEMQPYALQAYFRDPKLTQEYYHMVIPFITKQTGWSIRLLQLKDQSTYSENTISLVAKRKREKAINFAEKEQIEIQYRGPLTISDFQQSRSAFLSITGWQLEAISK